MHVNIVDFLKYPHEAVNKNLLSISINSRKEKLQLRKILAFYNYRLKIFIQSLIIKIGFSEYSVCFRCLTFSRISILFN